MLSIAARNMYQKYLFPKRSSLSQSRFSTPENGMPPNIPSMSLTIDSSATLEMSPVLVSMRPIYTAQKRRGV